MASSNGRHVPGTPYTYRHGWIPIIPGAQAHRNRSHDEQHRDSVYAKLEELHSAGGDQGDTHAATATRARKLKDDELESAMTEAATAPQMTAFTVFADEWERREAERARYQQRKQRDQARRAAHYEQLLDAGHDDESAIEQAYGISVDKQRRDRAVQMLSGYGYSGGFSRMSKQAFRDEAHQRYIAAENATRGEMLNQLGERKGIDPRSFFSGPESRVRKYASEELLAHFDEVGRLTYDDYVNELLTGHGAGASTGQDFYR